MFKNWQSFQIWTIFSLLSLILSWSLPAEADTKINPQLEQQVIQVIRQHPEIILESVRGYQEQQQRKTDQVRQEFIQELTTNLKGVIGDSPTTDPTQLKTVLFEFSDFQCPYCAEAHKTLKQLLAKYPHQLTLVYKYFPLSNIHDQAIPSAKAAWAAAQQGKFWEYHDALFTHQKQLGEALYLDIAKNLHLDLTKFNRDRTLAEKAVQKDMELAIKLNLAGTPSFLIKSQNFSGPLQLSEIENILVNKP
jgi:protein-disulfide isomerase